MMSEKGETLVLSIPLNVKTKLFSDRALDLNAMANQAVGFIDANQPGAICSINFEAVKKAVKLATFLKAKISPILSFDRRLFFSPIYLKGYQITQHHYPLATGGYLLFREKKVEFEKIILEESGAEIEKHLDEIIINYNRSGRAIVKVHFSNPFTSKTKLLDFLDELKKNLVSHEIYELKDEPITTQIQETCPMHYAKETDLPVMLLLKEDHQEF
jgi:aspartyl-tRNA(Asn)/glutamyl-tRNA(Gln) amidotransferase subunit B